MIIYDYMKGGDNIGRLLIMEYTDEERFIFDEVMEILKNIPNIRNMKYKMNLNGLCPDLKYTLIAVRYTVTGKRFI